MMRRKYFVVFAVALFGLSACGSKDAKSTESVKQVSTSVAQKNTSEKSRESRENETAESSSATATAETLAAVHRMKADIIAYSSDYQDEVITFGNNYDINTQGFKYAYYIDPSVAKKEGVKYKYVREDGKEVNITMGGFAFNPTTPEVLLGKDSPFWAVAIDNLATDINTKEKRNGKYTDAGDGWGYYVLEQKLGNRVYLITYNAGEKGFYVLLLSPDSELNGEDLAKIIEKIKSGLVCSEDVVVMDWDTIVSKQKATINIEDVGRYANSIENYDSYLDSITWREFDLREKIYPRFKSFSITTKKEDAPENAQKLVGGENVAEGIYKRKDDYQGYVAVTYWVVGPKQAKEPGYQVNMEYPKVDEEFILPELSEFETRLNNLNFY